MQALSYWMGIDGGGSKLRVVIVDHELRVVSQANGDTVNPSVIGHEVASRRIRAAVHAALADTNTAHLELVGAGIGIAGASASHSEHWLRKVFSSILPGVPVVLSSDLEIALVGALGVREGILILAGTGSAGYGVKDTGESLQVGGWGYLLGDEGSSFWIGMQALQFLARYADGRANLTRDFSARLLGQLGLDSEKELLPWLYRSEQPRIREVAQLARTVIYGAETGIPVAIDICNRAADELALLCHTVRGRLNMESPKIAFAGGLLDNDNFISQRLWSLLGLEKMPVSLHSPVIGAALLAQITLKL